MPAVWLQSPGRLTCFSQSSLFSICYEMSWSRVRAVHLLGAPNGSPVTRRDKGVLCLEENQWLLPVGAAGTWTVEQLERSLDGNTKEL